MAGFRCCCCCPSPRRAPSKNYINVKDVVIIQNECLNYLRYRPIDRILHLGCMHGKISIDYLTSSPEIVFDWFIAADDSEKAAVFKEKEPGRRGYGILDLLHDDLVNKYRRCWNGFTNLLCFSSYSWIKDPKKALENTNHILRDDGVCAFTFVSRSPVYDAYEKLAQNPAWAHNMMDYKELIPLSQSTCGPRTTFATYLIEAGFEIVKCEVVGVTHEAPKQDTIFEHIKDVSPIFSRIEEKRKLDFVRECAEAFPKEQKKIFSYELVVAIAKKRSYLFIPDPRLLKEIIGYVEDPSEDGTEFVVTSNGEVIFN